MKLEFTLSNIKEAAEKFIEQIGDSRVFAFCGEIGAGKTTFISEVCRLLGADDDFGSPTFSLVNEYADREGNPIYHFDFYRIESPGEGADMGAEDYFYSGNLCLIEWPDRIEPLLPDNVRKVSLSIGADGSRTIEF